VARYVALLRGINVGGRNKLSMGDLRALVERLGNDEVTTYIQSGNVVFTSRRRSPAALARSLEDGLAGELGVAVPAVVLSQAELARAIRDDPFPADADPKTVHAIFLVDDPTPKLRAAVKAANGPDSAKLAGRTLYVHTPAGFGTSKLAAELIRLSGGTARNRRTLNKLLELCG
jgi:uncharacterized protein (DUF1697 family)